MRTLRRIGMSVAFLVSLAPALPAQAAVSAPPAHDSVQIALIRQLLTQTHAVDQAYAAMEAGVPAQKAANPRIPEVFWERFLAEARVQRGEFEDLLVTVYARHFSSDDIRQLLAFYQTPVGQRVLSELPIVIQESMQAGQVWGQQIGAAIGAQLSAEGVRIDP